jgi:dynactin complex subunit
MTLQDKAKDMYDDIKSSLERILEDAGKEIEKLSALWDKITKENKAMLLEKKDLLIKKYEEYLAALKDKADSTKDDLAEKVGALKKKIEDIELK